MARINIPQQGINRQSSRAIPRRLSAVVEQLELLRPRSVTLESLGAYLAEAGVEADPTRIAHDLQQLGWLLPLRTRGHWEFAPAERAGAISSGDPFVELRATLERRRLPLTLAYDSAAWLQGLSTRQPHPHVI